MTSTPPTPPEPAPPTLGNFDVQIFNAGYADYTAEYRVIMYSCIGFRCIPLKPRSKQPYTAGWQTSSGITGTHWRDHPTDNIGVLLGKSNIVTVDIDNLTDFLRAMDAIDLGLDNPTTFLHSDTAKIYSGKPQSRKLVFRTDELPPGTPELVYHKLNWNGTDADPDTGTHTVFELRCGDKQDVLPPSIHPDTGKPYQWIGHTIKPIPQDLLNLWIWWDAVYYPAMEQADPRYIAPPPTRLRRIPQKREGRGAEPTATELIREYCNAKILTRELERYGYTRITATRYLSPHSHSGSAGIQIHSDDTFYSYGESDPFADGHNHNAYDLMLEYDYHGNTADAIRAVKQELGYK